MKTLKNIEKELNEIEHLIGKVISISYISKGNTINNFDFNLNLSKTKDKGINYLNIELLNIIDYHFKIKGYFVSEISLVKRKLNNMINVSIKKLDNKKI